MSPTMATSGGSERHLLYEIVGSLDDGVIALDAGGRVLLANPAARDLLELGGIAAGATLLDRVRSPAVHEAVGASLAGEPHEADAELPGPPTRHVRLRAAPAERGGALLVVSDRTRIARLERVRRDFVVNISHELRTPVSIIAASAEALVAGAIDEPEFSRQFVDAIERNARRLGVLVADLLDLSRIESGRQLLQRRALAIDEAIDDALASLEPALAAAEVSVARRRMSEDSDADADAVVVHADAKATGQILVNLLHNALKHSPRGGAIEVCVEPRDSDVRVCVVDEGPGVSADVGARLFERFYRAELGRERGRAESGGSGLGLAIVKHLVTAMGGEVAVASPAHSLGDARGPGAAFSFTLPVHRSVFSDAAVDDDEDLGGDEAGTVSLDAADRGRADRPRSPPSSSASRAKGDGPAVDAFAAEPTSDEAAILALGPGVQELRRRLLRMAGRVEEMIGASVRAVVVRDSALAARTILCDRAVNRDELKADELCLELLARAPESAAQLRFVTRSAKMVTDLERIADLAVNISERVEPLAAVPWPEEEITIERMAEIAQSMVRDVMDAFVAGDAAAARAVIARDDEVDALYHDVSRRLIATMASEPRLVEGGMHMQAVAKFLERIGDHATNLGEQVIFMARGDDVRHTGKRDGPAARPPVRSDPVF